MEKLRQATVNANKILLERLTQLSYFNNENFNKNIINLQRIITDNFLKGNQLLVYSAINNAIIFDESKIKSEDIPLEILEILILHEYIHMSSTDLAKQIIGFESPSLPIAYNESLTQWLTLKLYYGDKLEDALNTNFIYPESVRQVDKLIKELGEEVIYNHFFDADIQKNISELPQDKKDFWINTILNLSSSYEEQVSKENLEELQYDIEETKNQGTK